MYECGIIDIVKFHIAKRNGIPIEEVCGTTCVRLNHHNYGEFVHFLRTIEKDTGRRINGSWTLVFTMGDILERLFSEATLDKPKEYEEPTWGDILITGLKSIFDRVMW